MHHLFQHILEGIAAGIGLVVIVLLAIFLKILSDYDKGENPFL